jgi:hypothetical protein
MQGSSKDFPIAKKHLTYLLYSQFYKTTFAAKPGLEPFIIYTYDQQSNNQENPGAILPVIPFYQCLQRWE